MTHVVQGNQRLDAIFIKLFQSDEPVAMWILRAVGAQQRTGSNIRQLRAKNALMLFKHVPLRARRALSLYKVYMVIDSALMVLNGASLNIVNAILALTSRTI